MSFRAPNKGKTAHYKGKQLTTEAAEARESTEGKAGVRMQKETERFGFLVPSVVHFVTGG